MDAYMTDIDAMLDQMEEEEKELSPAPDSDSSQTVQIERPHSLSVHPEMASSFPDSGLGSSQELGPPLIGNDTENNISSLRSPDDSFLSNHLESVSSAQMDTGVDSALVTDDSEPLVPPKTSPPLNHAENMDSLPSPESFLSNHLENVSSTQMDTGVDSALVTDDSEPFVPPKTSPTVSLAENMDSVPSPESVTAKEDESADSVAAERTIESIVMADYSEPVLPPETSVDVEEVRLDDSEEAQNDADNVVVEDELARVMLDSKPPDVIVQTEDIMGTLNSDRLNDFDVYCLSPDFAPQPPFHSPTPEYVEQLEREEAERAAERQRTTDDMHIKYLISTMPTSKPARFRKDLWHTSEDVSDSELDQFLHDLDAPPVPPRDDYTLRTSSPVDMRSEASEPNELEQNRFSPLPPLELAPPVPMTLMDASEFDQMDLSPPAGGGMMFEELSKGFIPVEGVSSVPAVEAASAMDDMLVPIIPLIEQSGSTSMDEDTGSASPAETTTSSMMDESTLSTEPIPNDENNAPGPSTSTDSAPVIFSADNLGKVKPEWVPDEFAPICMLCGLRFTLVKRRHHCRACGSVICASCGNYRAKLEYMDNKEERICALCNETFLYKSGHSNPTDNLPDEPGGPSIQISTSAPVAMPPGVLRRQDRPRNSLEPKSVVFSDGIRPGGDLTEQEQQPGSSRRLAVMNAKRQRRSPGAPEEAPPPPKSKAPPKRSSNSHVVRLFINREVLPVMEMTSDGHNVLHEHPDLPALLLKFLPTPSEDVDFFVNSCLKVNVQVLDLKCCMGHAVWSYSTTGMRLVGQDEICVLLEKQDGDVLPPRDVFLHLNEIFLHAKQGNVVGNLGHSIVSVSGYPSGFLGNRNNAGFLFIRPSFQCLANLRLPEPPYLIGILMTKWEVPWAKLFPLRLMLRLGAEYRYYPCPLISFRNRKSVYEEIGHTVMNLLCDFRNFQYHLPCVEDTEACMEKGLITVRFPRHRYEQIVKVCQTSNEHVLPIGLDFSRRTDAHLVCIQNLENGNYETQAINIQSKGRQVTGTSFIIFNGSLKSMEHTECRASVVEDGIMVQITLRGLDDLKAALKDMKTIVFRAQSSSSPEGGVQRDALVIEWTDERKSCNVGVRSPIDGKDLSGVDSRRVSLKHSVDFLNGTLCVRCTEVFLVDEKDHTVSYREDVDLSRLAENLAMVTCGVMRGHLYDYRDNGWNKVGLRVVLGPDIVEYDVGAQEQRFGQAALMEFDEKIMRLVNECARSWGGRPRLEMELLFRIFQH